MDIMKLGTQLLMSKLSSGTNADSSAVQNALGSLMGSG